MSSAQGTLPAVRLQPGATTVEAAPAAAHDHARIAALDGLRGVLALMVCISHYFAEVAHGIAALANGWIAVKMFFVLSGFLMARIIVAQLHAPNFFQVFYLRRACRTLPAYFTVIAFVFACAWAFREHHWMEADRLMPLWSYLTMTQPFFSIARGDAGPHWLIPTWTLTVEEQFYLVAPLLCLLVPRHRLLLAVGVGIALSVAFRACVYSTGTLPPMAAMITLPAVGHAMLLGVAAALLLQSPRIEWARWDLAVRIAPIVILAGVVALKLADGEQGKLFEIVGVPLVAVACAAFLMSIVRGAPEAKRFVGPRLAVLGTLSYSLYLMHMPVLCLLHGLILGGTPDIGSPAQIAVTVMAVPLAIAVAWASARWIERPMIAWGRTWKWQRA